MLLAKGKIRGQSSIIRMQTSKAPSGLASPVSGTPNYYPWFDWLRLVLAGAVLFGHEGLIAAWPMAANFAVQVFFALSGWLIGGLLLNTKISELPRFYFNRALRIWCPYFLALSLLVAASLLRDSVTTTWVEVVFYKITFVYNLFGSPQLASHALEMPLAGTGNHFWSVNAEEQFYLLAPLLLVIAPPRYGRSVIVWIALATLAWVSETYASIVFGVLAAVIMNNHGAFQQSGWTRLAASLVAIMCAFGFAAGMNYESLAPICSIALVLLFAVNGHQHAWGQFAGGMSFPLYLNAWIAVFISHALFRRLGMANSFAQHASTIVLSLTIAGALYWYFDRRILERRKQIYTPRRARAAIAIAYTSVAIGIGVGLALAFRRS
jgi:peptidoglycan/LPS O-acetylase OafA/YrhL